MLLRFLYAVVVSFSLLLVGSTHTHAQNTASVNLGQRKEEILKYVNMHRTGMGLKPLTVNETIAQAAEKHSKNMATKVIPFSHDGFDERMARLAKQLKQVYGWSENVAYSQKPAKEVVTMWLNSPGHKRNIEGNYNLTGIGIARSATGELYYTQIFLRKQ